MFEVKGWKLSAPLKTDTSIAAKRSRDDNGEPQLQQTKTKKRKRGHGKTGGLDVTSDNLADVWQQHIEGKPAKEQASQVKKDAHKSKARKPEAVSKTEHKEQGNGATTGAVKPAKKQKKDMQNLSDTAASSSTKAKPTTTSKTDSTTHPTAPTGPPKLTALQSKMSHKLASARFRHLNQQLYTTPSADSLSLFTTNPDMFTDYHAGFAQQVEVWPENPVDSYVSDILTRGKVRGPPTGKGKPVEKKAGEPEPLPRIRDRSFQCVIADLGCGTAKIASTLQPQLKKLNLKIHSFDLHAPNPLVTAADISHLPLEDGSTDVAIACLALMGTNWIDFVEEAWRVLRWKGEFWVAEIKSRFSRSLAKGEGPAHSISKRQQKKQGLVGKEGQKKEMARQEKQHAEDLEVEVDGVESVKGETDVGLFVKVLERRGFVLEGTPDLSNKMFVKMRFIKAAAPTRGKHVKEGKPVGKKFVDKVQEDEFDEEAVLKPCVYKLR